MKAILAYWKLAAVAPITAEHVELVLDWREWIDPKNASPTATNYMLIEWPISHHRAQACIDVRFDSNGVRSAIPLLYAFSEANTTITPARTATGGVVGLVNGTNAPANIPPTCLLYDPAPRWLELLIEISKEVYAPYLKAENLQEALENQFLYAHHGPALVPSLEPNPIQKQKLAICLLWPDWQMYNVGWKERADQLEKVGLLNARNRVDEKGDDKNVGLLKTICQRLQLKKRDKVV